MQPRVCLTFNGHEICLRVPLLSAPFQDRALSGGSGLWMTGIDRALAHRLQAIATIAAVADQLSAAEAADLKQVLEPMISALEQRVPGLTFAPQAPVAADPGAVVYAS